MVIDTIVFYILVLASLALMLAYIQTIINRFLSSFA